MISEVFVDRDRILPFPCTNLPNVKTARTDTGLAHAINSSRHGLSVRPDQTMTRWPHYYNCWVSTWR